MVAREALVVGEAMVAREALVVDEAMVAREALVVGEAMVAREALVVDAVAKEIPLFEIGMFPLRLIAFPLYCFSLTATMYPKPAGVS
jgi:hypothetical protein